MSARLLLALSVLASTCSYLQPSPAPTPDPVPYPVPEPTATVGEDAGVPPAGSVCETAYAVQADAECAPAEGHDGWLSRCATLSAAALACVMSTDVCSTMRECLESR